MMGFFDANPTPEEVAEFFPEGFDRTIYAELLAEMAGQTDATRLFQLYTMRGDDREAGRYFAMLTPEQRRSARSFDLLP